jgi:hypothetical protein
MKKDFKAREGSFSQDLSDHKYEESARDNVIMEAK